MNALFKPALIASLLLLAGAAQYFTYAAYVSPRERAVHGLEALTEILQLESQKKKPQYRPSENRGVTIPDLLSRVQELAATNAVTITGIEPIPGDAEQFKLGLTAHYEDFLAFLARFESLQATINGFDVAPAMDMPGWLKVSIAFGHTNAPNTIPPERIKEFLLRLKQAALRDPFNPENATIQTAATHDPDDVTWRFHLTSISEIGKTKYATINGKDYNVGDAFQGFVIGAIGNTNVTLIDKVDPKRPLRVLTFRNPPRART